MLSMHRAFPAALSNRTVTRALSSLSYRGRGRQPRSYVCTIDRLGDDGANCRASPSRCFSTTETRTQRREGLYSIPELMEPSDFDKLSQEAIQTCQALAAQFEDTTTATIETQAQASRVLDDLDEISRVVCNVIDAAELCRSSHHDELWRQAADRAFAVLSDYIAQLNANTSLYYALQRIPAPVRAQFNAEQKRFAQLLQLEFERDGIHLSDETRHYIRRVQNSIVQLEGTFHRNLVTWERDFDASRSEVEQVLPRHVLEQMFGIATTGSTVALTSNSQLLQTLLKYSPSPNLRKQVYMEYCTAVPENLVVLQDLRLQRHQLATTVGFDSYVERAMTDNKMAQSTAHVQAFLQNLAKQNQAPYQQEMQLLQQAKHQMEGSSSGEIEPWDVSFYTSVIKQQSSGFDPHTVAQYLTLSQCLEALKILCRDLFGITMVEQDIPEGDRWDGSTATTPPDQRVRCFVLEEEATGRPLGTIYLDLHPRAGKYGHAAHFTVRCGCIVSSHNQTSDDEMEKEYQLPIVALVCNMSSSGESGQGLTHGDVETLFHEMGHALHSLLSRTHFQHMSGTRAAIDFVETPSHFLENFVWDASFLKILAVHPQTGESLPDVLIQKLQKSRHQLHAIDRQNQIMYALLDQQLFGAPFGKYDSESFFAPDASTEMFAQLHQTLGVPYAEGTHWQSRFGHLISYGAGYYSYLYAQEFAKAIWEQKFQVQPGSALHRPSGQELWQKVLIHGGAKDPQLMLQDLLGAEMQEDKAS